RTACFAVTLAVGLLLADTAPRAQESAANQAADVVLKPTSHPRLPADASQLWLAPDATTRAALRGPAIADFTPAVKLEVDNNFARALPILSQPALQQGTLGHYALYYQGLAELRVGRPADARRTFQALAARQPLGYLNEAAALREADADEALGDAGAGRPVYGCLSEEKAH